MIAHSVSEAWEYADQIFPSDYEYDPAASARAGYPVYASTADSGAWISDLGDRLEVNLADGQTVNIWVQTPEFLEGDIEDALHVINDAIYEIEDKIGGRLQSATGIDDALKLLYAAYGKIARILTKDYPESKLYRQFNLQYAE